MKKKRKEKKQILVQIGKAIQFWRKLEGHDQESFSWVLKTARSYVSRIEAGHSGISFSRIEKIAGLLGISPYTILAGIPHIEEVDTLLNLYDDPDYKITKKELELLFCARIRGKVLARDYYINLLSIIRSGIYMTDE